VCARARLRLCLCVWVYVRLTCFPFVTLFVRQIWHVLCSLISDDMTPLLATTTTSSSSLLLRLLKRPREEPLDKAFYAYLRLSSAALSRSSGNSFIEIGSSSTLVAPVLYETNLVSAQPSQAPRTPSAPTNKHID
jgi:hypothetical protein